MLINVSYNKKDKLIKSLVYTHTIMKKDKVSSASLRDIKRFLKIYLWFKSYLYKVDTFLNPL